MQMDRLMEELRKIKRDSDDKWYIRTLITPTLLTHLSLIVCSVVVSQWTSMLDIVEYHLTREGVTFGRIDGRYVCI